MLIGLMVFGVIVCYIMNGGIIVYMYLILLIVFYRIVNFLFKLCNYCFFNLNVFLNFLVGRVLIGFIMVFFLNFRVF